MNNAITFFLLSIFLYLFAPSEYSYNYCLVIFIFFLLASLWFLKRTFDGNYFNFHFLFLLSYFFVNFAYPIFLYPQNKIYFPVYKLPFDHNIITRATSIALIGITSYFLGAVLLKSKANGLLKPHRETSSNKSIIQILIILCFIFFILVIANSWKGIVLGKFGSTGKGNQYLLALFQISFELALILEVYYSKDKYNGKTKYFIKYFNKQLLIIGLLFTFLFIRVGDRGPVIQLVLILIVLYGKFVININLRMFISIVIIGMLIMTFISYARTKNEAILNDNNTISNYFERGLERMNLNSFFDLGMDLIVNNRNLYEGIRYADENGFSYGKNMFHYLFAAIPKLPLFMTDLIFNSTPTKLSSGYIITIEGLGEKATYGLGTNLIADVYMSFGTIGVVIFMTFFGYFIRKLQIYSETNFHIIYLITYLIMISFSVYLPRAPYFEPLRYILWSLFLYIGIKSVIRYINNQEK